MTTEEIKARMRQHHKLAENADVRIMATELQIASAADTHKFTARITTDALDRQDEVVLPLGGQFGEFLASGAIFWNHNYDEPVGYPDKGKQIVRGENFVEAGGLFMQRPADWKGDFFPDFVREFVAQGVAAGIRPGVSIGFQPLETRRPTKLDTQRYGERVSLVHSKWKLLEFSIAPVQANQEAVVTAVGKGIIKRDLAVKCGFALPPLPAPPPPPQKVQKAILVLQAARQPVDIGEEVERQMKREIYRRFGRVLIPA